MVAASVGVLILGASATAFLAAMRTVRSVSVSTTSVADARVAMEAVTRTLRVAYKPKSATSAVLVAAPNRVQFWALLNRTGQRAWCRAAPTAGRLPATPGRA